MRYYYKDTLGNYYNYKGQLWRTEEERTIKSINEQGEEVTTLDPLTTEEQEFYNNYIPITEEEFNNFLSSVKK